MRQKTIGYQPGITCQQKMFKKVIPEP